MLKQIFAKIRPGVDAENSKDIVGDYGLDSFDIIDLITQIELSYKIKLNLDDIQMDDFHTFESINNLIKRNIK